MVLYAVVRETQGREGATVKTTFRVLKAGVADVGVQHQRFKFSQHPFLFCIFRDVGNKTLMPLVCTNKNVGHMRTIQ